ncbi:MAG: hypothetical protein AAGI17_00245 [Planctomycetota bacterium]
MRRSVMISAALLASCSGLAFGQADLLRGPEVTDAGGTGSAAFAMRPAMDLNRMLVTPEQFVVQEMDLGAETAAAVGAFFEARAATLDGMIGPRREEVLTALMPINGTPGEERRERSKVMRSIVQPLLKEGLLVMRVAELLPEADRERYIETVAGVYEEIRDQRLRNQGKSVGERESGEMLLFVEDEHEQAETPRRGANQQRMRLLRGNMMTSMRIEIRGSLDRVVRQPIEDFQAAVAAIGLTPEQEGELRDLVMNWRSAQGDREAMRSNRRRAAELMQGLEFDQRNAVRDLIGMGRERRKQEKKDAR